MRAKPAAVRTGVSGALLALLVVFTSCASSEANGEVQVVGPREAVTLVDSHAYVVLDLRSREAFRAAHVAGARSQPYVRGKFAESLVGLDRTRKYLLYAQDPDIAGHAADVMVSLGFTRVVDAGSFGMLALGGAEVR